MMMSLLVVACGGDKSEGEKTANEVVKGRQYISCYHRFRQVKRLLMK